MYIHLKNKEGIFRVLKIHNGRIYYKTKKYSSSCNIEDFQCIAGGHWNMIKDSNFRKWKEILMSNLDKDFIKYGNKTKKYYLDLFQIHHPDKGGDAKVFRKIYSEYLEWKRYNNKLS